MLITIFQLSELFVMGWFALLLLIILMWASWSINQGSHPASLVKVLVTFSLARHQRWESVQDSAPESSRIGYGWLIKNGHVRLVCKRCWDMLRVNTQCWQGLPQIHFHSKCLSIGTSRGQDDIQNSSSWGCWTRPRWSPNGHALRLMLWRSACAKQGNCPKSWE